MAKFIQIILCTAFESVLIAAAGGDGSASVDLKRSMLALPQAAVFDEKCDFECFAAGLTAYGICSAECEAKFGKNLTVIACITAGCPPLVATATETCLKTNPACEKTTASLAHELQSAIVPVAPAAVEGEKCDFECAGGGLVAYGMCTAGCVAKFGHTTKVVSCITVGCPPVVAAAIEACLKTNPSCKDAEAIIPAMPPSIYV